MVNSNITTFFNTFIYKSLAGSNAGGASSHQSHIALTGDEIGFFPLFYNNLYFQKNYTEAKRLFLVKIPLFIHKEQMDYLGLTLQDDVVCYSHTNISRPSSPQVELGDSRQDSESWKNFKDTFQENDFLVFLKEKARLNYKVFLFREADAKSNNLKKGVATVDFSKKDRTSIDISKVFSNITLRHLPLQKIFFGAPGTGKSYKINELQKTFGAKEFKTVFHPDSDYTSFVGAYKPMMQGGNVRYAFVPQVFTKAYTHAWNNPEELVLLTIEEINRGNCAQIFGDLFQCLDRNASGMSEYAIDAEYDLAEYLKETLDNQDVINSVFKENYKAENAYSKIALPSNLLIYATMNTSDQSLFPMDSAFKRRWDWEYVPINYGKAGKMTIQLDETTTYNWGDFIQKINQKICDITQSEDKQLGNFFVKINENETISLEVFRSKVMFYLWSEIFKEENESDTIFKYNDNGEYKTFTFNQLYNENALEILKGFMEYNNVSLA